MEFRHIIDAQYELDFYELLEMAPQERRCLCAGQVELLRFYCYENNIHGGEEMFSQLLTITLRISRDELFPQEIDFNKLCETVKNVDSKMSSIRESYYADMFYVADVIHDVQEEYLKEIESCNTRKVIFEKSWQHHIGCENYWNKKLSRYAQKLNQKQ
jgi:hypothetical protein